MKIRVLFLLPVLAVALVIPLDMASAQSGVQIPNPIRCDTVNCVIANVVRYVLGTIALIATGMFVWGGITMMTSGGNAERVKKGKETLVWAVIGIIVVMLSWAAIRFVLGGLLNTNTT